jgi:hypothetical protein
MIEYKCLKCFSTFSSKYNLKRHNTRSLFCKDIDINKDIDIKNNQDRQNLQTLLNEQNIENKISLDDKKNIEDKKEYNCDKCENKFKYKKNLKRHIDCGYCKQDKNRKAKQVIIKVNKNKNNDIVNNGTINNINNINNGIINNITVVQHINPFGYENTDFLTIDEKIKILRSGHLACLEILKIVYSRNENKNFYKENNKNSCISYLKEDLQLDVFSKQECRKELFKNSTTLLYGIMLDCKDMLEFDEQLELMNNITSITNDVYTEIFSNELSNLRKELSVQKLDDTVKSTIKLGINNIIDKNIHNSNKNNNNKNNIKSFIVHASTNLDIKDKLDKDKIKIIDKKNNITLSLEDSNIIPKELEDICGKLDYSKLAKDLETSYYDNTKFAKELKIRENYERNYLSNMTTLGKLEKYNAEKLKRDKKVKTILDAETDLEKLKELALSYDNE